MEQNYRYTLGLDIGIASIGWALLDTENEKIIRMGVRAFEKAENPKDGSSLASTRRITRGARRRLFRRRKRLLSIREILVRHGTMPSLESLEELFAQYFGKTPYDLRAEGLDRLLTHTEWVRVLLHIAKHRGFKSNRKNETADQNDKQDEAKKLLAGVNDNTKILQNGRYRTAGEMMAKDEKFSRHKRNKAGDYSNTLARALLEDEANQLFDIQRRFGNPFAGLELQEEYMSTFLHQLPFASGDQILQMVGKCTFERDEKRAPRSSWTAERFMLLNKVINMRIRNQKGERKLTDSERNKVIGLAYKQAKVTHAQIRKLIDMDERDSFIDLRYKRNESSEEAEKRAFVELKGTHSIAKKMGLESISLSEHAPDYFDVIAFALTAYKTDDDIVAYLKDNTPLEANQLDALLNLSFNRYASLSIKAMRKIIPHMENGLSYNEACAKAGYNHSVIATDGQRRKFLPLPDTEEIRNPVVLRALHQVRKVVNAIIREYGSPTYVHIEMARDIAKSFDERRAIEREQEENRKDRERSMIELTNTFGINAPKGGDILKLRLYREQNGMCAYSQKMFDAERVIADGKYAEIDHILPFSRSNDNSYTNKVLVLSEENQNKRNSIPYEYFGNDDTRWTRFETWVNSQIKNTKKRQNLLRTSFTDEEASEMSDRNLTDTRYITRYVKSWFEDTLLFADKTIKMPVLSINGRMTSMLRGMWGLAKLKDREENDLHHALDAAVIAAASRSMIKRISDYSTRKELHQIYTISEDNQKRKFPEPWPEFRREVKVLLSPNPQETAQEEKLAEKTKYNETDIDLLKPIFVSRMPNRKATGAAHAETIRGIREGVTVTRTALTSLNLVKLEQMWGKERDKKLYEALKIRLTEHGGKGEKAFKEPFYKPTNDGTQGPLVRSIKLQSVDRSGIEIRHGRASNGGMVRVDVYSKDKKYYMVPHYVDDVAKKIVRNRAIVANVPSEDDWQEIDQSFAFLFSLFYNDLVRVVRGENKELFGYYKGTHRGTASLTIMAHDGSATWESIGVKTCKVFEKYQVDLLGDYVKINRESPPKGKRLWAGESSA